MSGKRERDASGNADDSAPGPEGSFEQIRDVIRQSREKEDRNPFSGGMSPVRSSGQEDTPEALFPVDGEPLPTGSEHDSQLAEAELSASRTREPVDVVRKYIRCWNVKAFGAEYACFMTHRLGLSKETYADRRMAVWLSVNRDRLTLTQELGRILVTRVKGAKAQVLCTRIQTEQGKRTVYLELYDLRQTGDEWRIYSVDTGLADDDLIARQMALVQE